jgi:phosphinothricin acetyltransferase
MSPSAIIRLATLDDASAIQSIYAPYVLHHIYSFELVPPTVEEMVGRIRKTLARYPWLVCTDAAGEVVGYAYGGMFNERAAYGWSVSSSVYVREGMQRRKIGRGLYTALFELLRRQGLVMAYAGITLPNDASVGLHRAMGFEAVGAYRNAGYKFGGWYDVSWWQLPLVPLPATPAPVLTLDYHQAAPAWLDTFAKGAALIQLE